MDTRKTLKKFFDEKQLPQAYIIKYEENVDFFDKLIATGNTEDKEFALNIKILYYINQLYHYGEYKKALKVIEQTEIELLKLKSTSKLYTVFKDSLTLNKGICLGRRKKYRESNVVMKALLAKKPDNEIYLGWVEGNNTSIFRQYCNVLTIIGFVLYLIFLFFDTDKQIVQNPFLRRIGLFVIIIALILQYFAPQIMKKRSKNSE